MSPYEAGQYEKLLQAVAAEVDDMRGVLGGHQARTVERTWQRLQTHGKYPKSVNDACFILHVTSLSTSQIRAPCRCCTHLRCCLVCACNKPPPRSMVR